MNARSVRIAVVGAGPGGLICARILQVHGWSVTVFEREASFAARTQGGTLDIHTTTGQQALREAGLLEKFHELARPEGEVWRQIDPFTAEVLVVDEPDDGQAGRPEIDRGQLRGLLLDSLAPGTVRWGCPVSRVVPLGDGTHRMLLEDGTSEDFDLVVGADGAWSRVRPALSEATPRYTGVTFVGTGFEDSDTRHPALARLVGDGTMSARSGSRALTAQRNSGGYLDAVAMFRAPEDWYVSAGLDFADNAAVRAHLLEMFDGWHDSLLYLLRSGDKGFVNRPLYALPVPPAWRHVPGLTLVGDAAHLMPPLGVGANLALLDGAELALALVAHPDLDAAVRAYEEVMLPRAADLAERTAQGLDHLLPPEGAPEPVPGARGFQGYQGPGGS
ncbi:FAD-dependent oxidoreductase [Streptomyces abikoensis]|uniref:FAD-dependent oxidoreductase n=1 Tax=Streptomyces abikoensis TaxID=97398 RepID=UPI0016793F66|nr:NAD(P)/FAD-dependent oxidoreductase [Streptomyces abikoensis]GGP33006.1 monooxygenase [Streptomyces abikoensis]